VIGVFGGKTLVRKRGGVGILGPDLPPLINVHKINHTGNSIRAKARARVARKEVGLHGSGLGGRRRFGVGIG